MLTEFVINYINTNKREIIECLLLSSLITFIFFFKSGKFRYELFLINTLLLFKVFMIMKSNSPNEFDSVKTGAGIGIGTILLTGGGNGGNCGNGGDMKGGKSDKSTDESTEECKCNEKKTKNLTSNIPVSNSPNASNASNVSDSSNASNSSNASDASTESTNNLKMSNICESLIKNGFDPTWTQETIINMKKILKTRRKLLGINRRVKEDLNLQNLTNSDLQKCFPEYMPIKICKLSEYASEEINTKSEANAEFKAESETEEKKIYSCIINNLFEELKQSIISHYSENNLPTYIDPSKLKLIINYVTERASNEIKLLMNKYQGFAFGIFENHLNIMISQNKSGLPITGTSYFIPWDLFGRYIGCFGK